MNRSYKLYKESDELKKLILENPDLPIVVLAGEDSNNGYCGWMFCSRISFDIVEILDCDFYDYNDSVFMDRDRLEEYIADSICDDYADLSDEDFDKEVKKRVEEFEPYWIKAIAIYADN